MAGVIGMFEAEEQGRDAFQRRDSWWRLQYEIVEEPQPPESHEPTVPVITALEESELEWYDPLHEGELPAIQGAYRDEDSAYQSTPHMHLARLDLSSRDAILEFVNKWGLLGLWEVPEYRNLEPFLAEEKKPPKGFEDRPCSGWYLSERYRPSPEGVNPSGKYLHTFCEPLETFCAAAGAYQRDVDRAVRAAEEGNTWEAPEVCRLFTLHGCQLAPVYDKDASKWELGGQCRSLLDWIRFRTVLDMVAPHRIRKCPGCGRVFVPANKRAKYCNRACNNKVQVAKHRRRASTKATK
jgi:hypothetical protein